MCSSDICHKHPVIHTDICIGFDTVIQDSLEKSAIVDLHLENLLTSCFLISVKLPQKEDAPLGVCLGGIFSEYKHNDEPLTVAKSLIPHFISYRRKFIKHKSIKDRVIIRVYRNLISSRSQPALIEGQFFELYIFIIIIHRSFILPVQKFLYCFILINVLDQGCRILKIIDHTVLYSHRIR